MSVLCSTYGTISLYIIFNPTKCCLFKIGKDFSKTVPALCIDDENIAWVDTLKHLGMYFDSSKTVKVNAFPIFVQYVSFMSRSANNIIPCRTVLK